MTSQRSFEGEKSAECAGGWYHRYELKRAFPDCQEEVCAICKKRIFIRIRNGKVDNYKYVTQHLRQALQPWHPRFKKEYGKR